MTSTATKPSNRRPAIDPRFAQRWIEARREEGRRRLRVLAAVGSVAAVALILVGLIFSPAFEVRHVLATETSASTSPWAPTGGLSAPPQSQLAAIAGVPGHPLMIKVDTSAAARRLDADPWLADARVVRSWPDTVRISVRTRSPIVAVPEGPPTAPTGYALVDPTGRVLGISATAPTGLPLLTVTAPTPAVGRWLPGTVGAAGDPALPAGKLTDMEAPSTAADVPAPIAAALAVVDVLPSDLLTEVTSVSTTPDLILTVVGPATRGAAVTFELGDGSQLAAKASALQTLIGQADLSGVASVDLTVPSRPEATVAGGSSASSSSASG